MALTKDRRLIEIEAKISLADFKKDALKRKWKWQKYAENGYYDHFLPSQFFYIIPPNLVEKIKPLLKEGQGLLTYKEYKEEGDLKTNLTNLTNLNAYTCLPELEVIVNSKIAHRNKMPIKDMLEIVRHQSGTICSLYSKLAKMENHE